MYKVHIFLGGELKTKTIRAHLPHTGDTIRFSDTKYATVTEVVWCLDESSSEGERVNLRTQRIK